MSKGKKIIKRDEVVKEKKNLKEKIKPVHIIVTAIIVILAVTSIVLSVRYSQMQKEKEFALKAVDVNLRSVMSQIAIDVSYDEMTDTDIYSLYSRNASACDSALLIVHYSNYAKYDKLSESLRYFSLYLKKLVTNQEKLTSENIEKLNEGYFNMLSAINTDDNIEENIEVFYETVSSLYEE